MASISKSKLAESAQKLLAKGQIDKALKEYEKILQVDSGDASTRLKVGDLKLRLGQKEAAILEYRRVADKFTQGGFYSKAVAVLKRVIAMEPHLLEAHHELASLNQKLGLLSEVVHHYQIAANIHDRRGEKREAIDVLKKVADIGPPNLERRIKVAELYYREGLRDSGFEQFEAAVAEIDPQSSELIALTRRMWKACPNELRLGRRFAELCLGRGDAKLAAEVLEEACENVRDPELVELLADAKISLDLPGEARTLFEEAAGLYRVRGNAARAQALSARSVELASAALDVAVESGESLLDAPAPAGEEPILAEEIPLDALSPAEMTEEQHLEAALSEADVYRKYGKNDRAVTILEELATRYPHRHEAPLRLRAIFEACGDWMSVAIQSRRLARVAEGRGDVERAARFDEEALEAEVRAQGQALLPDVAPGIPPEIALEVPSPEIRGAATVESEEGVADESDPMAAAGLSRPSTQGPAAEESEADFGDIELVIEGEEEEEPPAPGDEPDLILDDAFDDAPASPEALVPDPAPAAQDDLGEITLDLEEAESPTRGESEAPAARSVEDDLILQEISRETGSLLEAEEIISAARVEEPEAIPDPSDGISLEAAEPPFVETPPAPDETEDEIVLLDTPPDDEMEEGGHLDAFNEPMLSEPEPSPGEGFPVIGEAPRAEVSLGEPVEEGAAGGSEAVVLPEQAPDFGENDFDLRAELNRDGAPPDALAHATKELSQLVSALQHQEETVPSPEDSQAHYDLGIAYKEMGLLDDAIRELKMAVRDPGRRIEGLAVLGICYCEQGKPEEALGVFERCLTLGGSSGKAAAGILYEMALVHEEAGHGAEALECYRRVAEINPDYRETRSRAAKLSAEESDSPRGPSDPVRPKKISYL